MLTVCSAESSEIAIEDQVRNVCSRYGAVMEIRVFQRRPGWDVDPFALVRMRTQIDNDCVASVLDGQVAGRYALIPLRFETAINVPLPSRGIESANDVRGQNGI